MKSEEILKKFRKKVKIDKGFHNNCYDDIFIKLIDFTIRNTNSKKESKIPSKNR